MARIADPAKVAAWRERFSRFESSGMTTAEFCAAEGVGQANFNAWRRKLGFARPCAAKSQPRAAKPPAPSPFQQVLVSAAPALSARLPGGVELEASGADPQALRTIVGELVRASQACEAHNSEARSC